MATSHSNLRRTAEPTSTQDDWRPVGEWLLARGSWAQENLRSMPPSTLGPAARMLLASYQASFAVEDDGADFLQLVPGELDSSGCRPHQTCLLIGLDDGLG